ncbi:MAG: endonuclease/exonuclease/phosphatase family protein [Promethearchaeia archaeon]
MLKDIFGAIVPSLQDALVSFFLPQGLFILFNLILISLELGTFLVSRFLYNRYVNTVEMPLKKRVLPLILIYIAGLFNTFILGMILIASVLLSISYLLKVRKSMGIKKSKEKKMIKPSTLLRSGILVFLLFKIFLLVLYSIGGLLFAFLLGWWIYGWTLQIAAVGGVVIFLVKKYKNIGIFEMPPKLSSRSKILLKVTILTFFILFGSIFIISLTPNTHQPAPESPTSSEITDLKIMTYNIRRAGIEDDPANQWVNRKDEFVSYLDGFDLDVFGIQEAKSFQIQYIHSNLESRDYVWTGKGRDNGVHGGEACAIFFDNNKFEYLDGDTFWLSEIPHYPTNTWEGSCFRVVTWVRLKVKVGQSKGEEFFVFNTHYDFSDDWQNKASILVSQKITELSGGLPTILMGDFNMHNDSQSFDILENYENPGDKKPMRDGYREYKESKLGYLPYDTTSPNDWDVRKDPEDKSRIDFIFISEHINVTECQIPKDSYDGYRTYSDHYPVYMNCTL